MSDTPSNMPPDDWRDRLVDRGLAEKLGGETPPDLSDDILAAANLDTTCSLGEPIMTKATGVRRFRGWALAASLLVNAALITVLMTSKGNSPELTMAPPSPEDSSPTAAPAENEPAGEHYYPLGNVELNDPSEEASRPWSEMSELSELSEMAVPAIELPVEDSSDVIFSKSIKVQSSRFATSNPHQTSARGRDSAPATIAASPSHDLYAGVAEEMEGFDVADPPVVYPDEEVWEELSNRRERYKQVESSGQAGEAKLDDMEILPESGEHSSFSLAEAAARPTAPRRSKPQGPATFGAEVGKGLADDLSLEIPEITILPEEPLPTADYAGGDGRGEFGMDLGLQGPLAFDDEVAGETGGDRKLGLQGLTNSDNLKDGITQLAVTPHIIDSNINGDGEPLRRTYTTPMFANLGEQQQLARSTWGFQPRGDWQRWPNGDWQGRPDGEGNGPGAAGDRYERIVENPFLAAIGGDAVSTFSIDVDTASYANIRQMLLSGHQPPADAVRIEELVNYFEYGYEGPVAAGTPPSPETSEDTPVEATEESKRPAPGVDPFGPGVSSADADAAVDSSTPSPSPSPQGGGESNVAESDASSPASGRGEEHPASGSEQVAPFAAHVETAACPWRPEHRLVRIGIKGREIPESQRPVSNLVFLVDVSGSMNDPDKLPLVKHGLRKLTEKLGENDRVAIVVYASSEGLALPSTPGTEQETILAALDRLNAGGSTAGGAGIRLAYQLAEDHFIQGGTNRVILCTDGDFNVGLTNPAELERLVEQKANDTKVFLSCIGFGRGNLNDQMMEKISGIGNGNYYYADSEAEAERIFARGMTGMLVTIAKDVKIQVEFNPAKVAGYRLLGYENRMLKTQDFNDDKKDAGEIGSGHTVTCLYEVVPAGEPVAAPPIDELKYQHPAGLTNEADTGDLLTLKMRYKQPDEDVSSKLEWPISDSGHTFGQASTDFQFASAVAGFGMLLRDSQFKGLANYDAVIEIAESSLGSDPTGDRAEFVELVRAAKKLMPEPVAEQPVVEEPVADDSAEAEAAEAEESSAEVAPIVQE
ncbi:YfbK domain-containing protein [Aeoliella mucimassa]|uniref:von Willebrand factor n=1 Tax=Aeoliella mucimassa TaxID=2527972 RepID=A0A518AI14_9BACT|nr:von Willebrand factor type A domain-containing protein [Aeoliella mucimassa]QDU54370.1 von Willebrand factor [Aeoliella mucimassa]